MKKTGLLALAICLALLLCGCGKDETEAVKLSFAESANIETLNGLDGRTVTITGYMATLSPLDGQYIYLMNIPYQSCPFCVPNTAELSNTMAVFAADNTKFEFTDRPIKITGTLKIEDRVDDYGYSYNYFIDDASYEIVDLSAVSYEYAFYNSLAEDGVIGDVNAMFDYLMFVCQWTEYIGSYTDDSGSTVSYYLYPGDAENMLADEGAYGYAAKASADYFPGLIGRVQAISKTESEYLVSIIVEAQEVEQYARSELAAGNYTYDADNDKYILDNGEELYNRFYEVYLKFSEWLANYQL